MTEQDRPEPVPFSWDALAAELEATRVEAEDRGDADPATWDAVARELATRVGDRPVEELPPAPISEPLAPPQDPTPADVPVAEVEPLELLSPEQLADVRGQFSRKK